ncbi:glutaredoxin-like protein NrdH [Bifidobacterium pullorum subsp. saeculare]|uniref:Glutaredoxin-like protein NrdH n=1 Tax=Bifidobacterium pullorum subsp. saeculare TaxID=78257 RepID=A0A939BAL4_9BIFI|nr:glutaredoxin-like protein NrdH [Bifidobacterium pullorum]MBM6700475.1 glutaredoxin-like protein NrdH [Bifidobacterium pullorum subsp. saeculare]
MSVTVYTKPNCPQCEATKRQLDKRGIAYAAVDIASTPGVLETLQAAGFRQAPVVVTSSGHAWAGYRPDKIRDLAVELGAAAPAAMVAA